MTVVFVRQGESSWRRGWLWGVSCAVVRTGSRLRLCRRCFRRVLPGDCYGSREKRERLCRFSADTVEWLCYSLRVCELARRRCLLRFSPCCWSVVISKPFVLDALCLASSHYCEGQLKHCVESVAPLPAASIADGLSGWGPSVLESCQPRRS